MDRILGLDIYTLLQMGVMLLNILITIFIVYKLLYKPVLNFMGKRADRIKSQIDDAQAALQNAEALRVSYEEKLTNVEIERNEILESARKRAQDKETSIISEAKEEAMSIKNRAQLEIEREQEKARDEMKKEIVEISSLMAGRFIASQMDESTQNKLLDEVISDLGDIKWQN